MSEVGEKRARLIELMRACVKDKKARRWAACSCTRDAAPASGMHGPLWLQLDRKMALETFDPECSQTVGLLPDAKAWSNKEVKFRTRMLYTVNK